MHFTDLMTSKLVGSVKLVGPTIKCTGERKPGRGMGLVNPQVQSHAFATDSVGLRLLKDGGVFACLTDVRDPAGHGERQASAAVLQAGYTIDSFMVRQSIRHVSNPFCRSGTGTFTHLRVSDV